MPIPFIAGAIIGAAAVALYNKKGASVKESLSNFNGEEFAKKAGEITENALLKIPGMKKQACEEAKNTGKKAKKC